MSDAILDECRRRLGPAPRRFGWYDRTTYLFTARPIWAANDPIGVFFTHRQRALSEGIVVWGHIVQANQLLYRREPGATGGPNCPGEVVYCPDPDSEISLRTLGAIAHDLYGLKGKPQESDELQFFADYLANERVRVFGKPVPDSLSPAYNCRVSTVFFERDHLPDSRLCQMYFPLIVLPDEPWVALPLPARYWPPAFAAAWKSG